MASPVNDYKDTLNKMANLDSLSKFIVTQNIALDTKRGLLTKTLTSMQAQIAKIRDQIDNIRSKGATATTEMNQVIKASDAKQQQALENIQNNIKALVNMDKLETSIKNLEGDINALTSAAGTGMNPSAAAFVPGAVPPPAPGPGPGSSGQAGGYTYGKSRKREKGRRRRTKNSRKKGYKRR
jgi:hypothetical protein